MRVVFYGYSDDNVELDIDGKPYEEFGCYGVPVVINVSANDGTLGVRLHHTDLGWEATAFVPKDHEDGQPIIPCKMYLSETGYSIAVEFDVEVSATMKITVGSKLHSVWNAGRLTRTKREDD